MEIRLAWQLSEFEPTPLMTFLIEHAARWRIVVVTARSPFLFLPTWLLLKRLRVPAAKLYLVGSREKKADILLREQVDLFVDNEAANIELAAAAGLRSRLYLSPRECLRKQNLAEQMTANKKGV